VVDFVLIVFILTMLVVWVSAVTSASGYTEAEYKAVGRNKIAVVMLIVITNFVGGVYYWLVIRREVKVHRTDPPTVPRGRFMDPTRSA
jgi:hypothetical protein